MMLIIQGNLINGGGCVAIGKGKASKAAIAD